MTNINRQNVEDEWGINFGDVMEFFLAKWKLLLIGALLGAAIALGGALSLGKYEAETKLINKSGIDRAGIDYLTWKSLKRDLPILAARISEKNNTEGFFKGLSSEMWWQNNVVPMFAISKEDTKAILGLSKELQEAGSTRINDFVFKAAGTNKEDALRNLSTATSFFRSGAAYLALKDVITNYQIELLHSESEITRDISALEVELAFLNARLADLESIKAKFPGNFTSIITQNLDSKDVSSKYLPISLQLIAAYRDIGMLKEKLSRLTSEKNQLEIKKGFISQALLVMDKNFDGLSAVAELMRIESDMRKNVQPSDWNKIMVLDAIKYDLALINTRFTSGLEQPSQFRTVRPPYLKNAALGLVSGFFLALIAALSSVVQQRYLRQKLQ